MHHPPQAASFDSLAQQHQRQMFAAGNALGGMYGNLGTEPSAGGCAGGGAGSCEGGSGQMGGAQGLQMPGFGGGHADASFGSLDRGLDYGGGPTSSLQQMLLR